MEVQEDQVVCERISQKPISKNSASVHKQKGSTTARVFDVPPLPEVEEVIPEIPESVRLPKSAKGANIITTSQAEEAKELGAAEAEAGN